MTKSRTRSPKNTTATATAVPRSGKIRARYEADLERLQKEAMNDVKLFRESRRLSDRDLQVHINVRG